MARIDENAPARMIERCVKNAQDANVASYGAKDSIVDLGDAIIALTNQVKLLNEAVRALDDRHVSIELKTRSKIRIWME